MKNQNNEKISIEFKNEEKSKTKKVYLSNYNIGFCPTCHSSLWQNRDESNYCFRCGQKIEW